MPCAALDRPSTWQLLSSTRHASNATPTTPPPSLLESRALLGRDRGWVGRMPLLVVDGQLVRRCVVVIVLSCALASGQLNSQPQHTQRNDRDGQLIPATSRAIQQNKHGPSKSMQAPGPALPYNGRGARLGLGATGLT